MTAVLSLACVSMAYCSLLETAVPNGRRLSVAGLVVVFNEVEKGRLGALPVVTRRTFSLLEWKKRGTTNIGLVSGSANALVFIVMGTFFRIVFVFRFISAASVFFFFCLVPQWLFLLKGRS